jgi:TFIIF-interacting CTD phosphatase-like protein
MLVDLHLLVALEYKVTPTLSLLKTQGSAGWIVTKRPGVDYFVQYMSRLYELCVLQSTPMNLGTAVLDKIDPTRSVITYRVYQHLMASNRRGFLRRLEKLNRPLEKLVFLDSSKENVDAPDNVLVIPKWDGVSPDTSLLDIIGFLQGSKKKGKCF